MSFFKKIFGKEEPAREMLERQPRISTRALENVEFYFNSNNQKQRVPIVNLSSTGIALAIDPKAITTDTFEGEIKLKSVSMPIRLEVKRRHENLLGCKFIDRSPEFIQNFQNALKTELIGVSLNPMDPQFMSRIANGTPHWFIDRDENEFYYISENNHISYFHMSFDGVYIEGGQSRPLKTGSVLGYHKGKMSNQGSEQIQYDKEVSADKLQKARGLILSIKQANPDELMNVLQLIETK